MIVKEIGSPSAPILAAVLGDLFGHRSLVDSFDQLFDAIPAPESREDIDDTLRTAGYKPAEVALWGANIAQATFANSGD